MGSQYLNEILDIVNSFEPKSKALPFLELDSMMLSQVVEVAQHVGQNDINNMHVQNWVRRKYLPKPQKKKYSKEQMANILILNDLRNILSLEEVSQLLGFVNKNLDDNSDDRINPAKLYSYYARIFDNTHQDWVKSLEELGLEVNESLEQEEMEDEDRDRVATTLVILNLLAQANLYKQIAQYWLKYISGEEIKDSGENDNVAKS